ncbi:hypothetical protein [Nonomuraea fuscirosea]|uniref:hypothetical protein n=1 Tax=Nonomuraea fuscirosea TaxID=1291556 RepID=UPI0033D4466B
MRIIDAQITVSCAGGTVFTGSYRLVTSLTDARRHPADVLVGLYHQRWEHESAYYALRHIMMQGRVLRSGDPAGLEQEMWALLTLYQLLRTAMVDAVESLPGTDPDRCSFTIALQSARDQVIQAAGVTSDDTTPGAGAIARAVLAGLLPARRLRVSTRKVKSPVSRYKERLDDGRPDRSRTVTGLVITLLQPVPTPPAVSRDERSIAPAERRRQQQVLTLLHQDPDRAWPAQEIARHLGDVTLNTMYRQLSRWANSQLIRKIGPGIYTARPISSALLPAAQKP